MIVFKYLLVAVLAYLLGSFSFAIAFTANRGKDIRNEGSGNSGATNMARVFGWKAGVFTLLADVLKACVAIGIGILLLGDWGLMTAGMAVMTGHCFPVFYKFKGGKGVSVGAAIGFMIDWRVFAFIMAVFLVTVLLSRKVSLGSVFAALAITVAALLFGVSAPKLILAVFSMTLAIWRHLPNIKRLLNGTEQDFKFGHKKI